MDPSKNWHAERLIWAKNINCHPSHCGLPSNLYEVVFVAMMLSRWLCDFDVMLIAAQNSIWIHGLMQHTLLINSTTIEYQNGCHQSPMYHVCVASIDVSCKCVHMPTSESKQSILESGQSNRKCAVRNSFEWRDRDVVCRLSAVLSIGSIQSNRDAVRWQMPTLGVAKMSCVDE